METIVKKNIKNQKLKIIPGRGLSGRDIKRRLNNRTLEGQIFGDEAYTLNEDMDAFMKMSKVEQIEAIKSNSEKINAIKKDLEGVEATRKKKQEEAEIERKVQAKLKELGKQEFNNNQNQSK